MNEKIIKWNNLSDIDKVYFGDRYITNESNLKAWCKDFEQLSDLKRKRVLHGIDNFIPPTSYMPVELLMMHL